MKCTDIDIHHSKLDTSKSGYLMTNLRSGGERLVTGTTIELQCCLEAGGPV